MGMHGFLFAQKRYTGSIIYIHCCCTPPSSLIPRITKLREHVPEANALRFSLQTRCPENGEQRE